ncbi:MAG: prolyl oligopeptidase family serine peptidase [Bacteroidota bacterium]|nr:prolyl oligopeptidase family serine peptidase [Bacteroidota bacterium]
MNTLYKSAILLALLVTQSFFCLSQEALVFQKPSKEILALADYTRAPNVSIDSKVETMLFMYRNAYKTLEDLNQDELRLGGLRINPNTNMASATNFINRLTLKKIKGDNEIEISGMPQNAKISTINWSPNEQKIAFLNTTNNAVDLWIIDVATATAKKINTQALNANLGQPYSWFPNSQSLLVKIIPANKLPLINAQKSLPVGPTVAVSENTKSQNRTYQDLLKNPTDEINFERLIVSNLAIIDLSGNSKTFKENDLYVDEKISPDGNYILVTTLEKPFSYIVPYNRFPMRSKVYTLSGDLVKEVNYALLNEVMAKGFMAVKPGKRNINWRSDKPASLYYVEALDEGNPANKVEFRDELFEWEAPFTQAAKSIFKTQQRFSGVIWGTESIAIATDTWYDTRNEKTYLFNPSNSAQKPVVISDRNYQDIYSDPGNFVTEKNQFGRMTLKIQNQSAFLIGDGFTAAGQFPFIDKFDLVQPKTQRIYQCNFTNKQENILSITDYKNVKALVLIQSKNEYPNYYIRDLQKKASLTQITAFKNPFESIKNVSKELIKYKRKDGVELSGTLYLPAGYDKAKKQKLPLLIWAYPREYKDKNTAGQSDANPNEFTIPYYGSFVYWVTKGYAVLDDAAFPIIGEADKEPNDNFINQLVDNAEAAIDAVDKLGFIDRNKVGVGGHSYGAFMTANLLTHSKLFACGIARSGAYNRTLTPFGFQSEQRNYWEIPEIYNGMSPFMNAEKMKTPMLLVHGEADNNPGTFTLQTERYFQALKGLGAPVRMVLLPKESHGYAAKENILHLLWEQEQFLDKYLMNKK